MILVDVNVLVYAVFTASPRYEAARAWLTTVFNGTEPVALPWVVLTGFIRVSTNRRVMSDPLTLDAALAYLDEWLTLPVVRIIGPTPRHWEEFVRVLRGAGATGNLVSDAHLAALAIEHGCTLASADDDFRKFPGLRWFNPLVVNPPPA